MAIPQYATLATFRMDPAHDAEQRSALRNIIVPGVQRHPGFVAGTWTHDPQTHESFVMLTYQTLESAEQMRGNIQANAAAQHAVGIELVAVRLLEVSASASSVTD